MAKAKKNGQSEVIRKYIDENPKVLNKKEIARNVMALRPDIFHDLENARGAVRYVTGAKGDKSREWVGHQERRFFYNGFDTWAQENLNTELAPWDEPFVIPTSIKQLNIISDLHSVHMDPKVMKSFLKRTTNKEAVLLNGDLMDSESLSRHLKSHNVVEYDKELELCHQILKGLKEEFDHVYFKAGNHDNWLERYLLTNAREVFRLRGLELHELLRCGELGVQHIHNLKYVNFGDLDIIHAHEFPGFGMGKFPATGLVDKWQTFKHQYEVKILGAHSHKIDTAISKKSKDGKFGHGYAMGCMCRKAAGFNPFAGWDQGCVDVSLNCDNLAEVKLIRL